VDHDREPGDVPGRKRSHLQACLGEEVAYQRVTTGLERYELPYTALPETDLAAIDTSTEFLGKPLAAPVLIGAMTGGAELAGVINHNLAAAAAELGLGMMLGSQRVMLERPAARESFQVRDEAPGILLIGNLGAAQLNKGYGPAELSAAVEEVGADALALHTNPLQEACQPGGDTDFRGLAARIRELTGRCEFPLMLKEVGHGLSGAVAHSVARSGLAALDVAGAGGTSWARVEQLVARGRVVSPELAEWGIPTARALTEVAAAVPGMPLVASGGIRSGLDAAKAIGLGASVVAVAHPLLAPAADSAERVIEWLSRFVGELRVAMHCSGARDLDALAKVELIQG
jgi:isopentenyl-diphosphate delta-isomerase